MKLAATLAVFSLTLAISATAADKSPPSTGISVEGHVAHPAHLAATDLAALPQKDLDISFETGHGQESAHYTGALLWDVLSKADITDEPGPGKHHLQHTVLVSGSDGYTVALSIGELDPDFEGKTVILTKDFRLLVPGDKHGGRAVRNVVKIDVE